MDGWIDAYMDGRMDAYMHEPMDRSMIGWMDGNGDWPANWFLEQSKVNDDASLVPKCHKFA